MGKRQTLIVAGILVPVVIFAVAGSFLRQPHNFDPLLQPEGAINLVLVGALVAVTVLYVVETRRLAEQNQREQQARLRPWLGIGDLKRKPWLQIVEATPGQFTLNLEIENAGLLPAHRVAFHYNWIHPNGHASLGYSLAHLRHQSVFQGTYIKQDILLTVPDLPEQAQDGMPNDLRELYDLPTELSGLTGRKMEFFIDYKGMDDRSHITMYEVQIHEDGVVKISGTRFDDA